MNYLSGALRYVAGGEADSKNAIPRLVERIKTSALPQDRRAAISSLADAAKVSPQNQILVGELALKVLYAVLEQDKDYDDNLKAALELLIAICGTLDPPQNDLLRSILGPSADTLSHEERLALFEQKSAQATATNVDVFLGLPNAVSLLLDLLEKTDFYVKFGTIELLTAMAANSRHTLQIAVLEAPQGVSRICDLLDDKHRHVRSNAVLLLSTLCDESQEICKIVAYGGVLEKLFALIDTVTGESRREVEPDDDDDDDENLEAAIVVQDVLLVLRNLINGASTTRTFFRDTGCLPRLVNVVKRCTEDAGISHESTPSERSKPAHGNVGMKAAVENQARKNLVLAMNCISSLVKERDDESRLVKDILSSTNLFNLLASLAFTPLTQTNDDSKLPEHMLQVRIGALKTMALLARGHDEFRALFGSSSSPVSAFGEVSNTQVAAMRMMSKDPSSAARAAAYAAFRESFVVDSGLDLPSSSLLNAMTISTGSAYTVGEGRSAMRQSTTSASSNISSPSSPLQVIAESLKGSLVGWPNDADAAGVFYAASLVTWVVDKVQGSRERLLASYVNGSPLLPQMIRVLGKLEREKGPAEVRIGLFALACAWLHNSPSAVSAFLSSAMHLPMLVEVLNRTGSRGDIAEVHVRGLAAVLVGICLQTSEGSSETGSDGGFVSGLGGASAVIPRQTLVDVIRNRVGVTEFTACLDDLRASNAFSGVATNDNMWNMAERLVGTEERSGFLSVDGSLGHEMWYNESIVAVVDDVYKNVGAKALDLISDQPSLSTPVGNGAPLSSMMNGYTPGVGEESSTSQVLLADSARDEVLNSYKEFIRSQDESLSAARRQIEELSTALRETQLELDAKVSEASAARESETVQSVKEANAELTAQNKALEALLEEKSADFAALSDAYAALEEDQNSRAGENDIGESSGTGAEILELRAQNSRLRESLDTERSRSTELYRQANMLENSTRVNAAELQAVRHERDQLRTNSHPNVSEALQWRTRAEVAEAELTSRQVLIDSVQQGNEALIHKVQQMEEMQDKMSLSASLMERKLHAANAELEDLRAARKRELQVSRQSTLAAEAAAQKEIADLRKQLSDAVNTATTSNVRELSEVTARDKQRLEALEGDHKVLLASFEQLQTELIDTKNALTQWQRKGEASEAAKVRETAENVRLSNIIRSLKEDTQTLKESVSAHSQASSASSVRVAELERQNAELEEVRVRSDEEAKVMKEELAARTEQSIRLSGQLYEAEEANVKLEEELGRLRTEIQARNEALESEKQRSAAAESAVTGVEATREADSRLVALQAELEAAKDALADSQARERTSHAHAVELRTAIERASSLEQNLEEAGKREKELQSEVGELQEKLLSLNEAEEAKRSLTMQVVSLQKSLAESARIQNATGQDQSKLAVEEVAEYEKNMRQLRTKLEETNAINEDLKASLDNAMNRNNFLEREKSDLEKQITESETMLSVLNAQRDDLATECEQIKEELSSRPRPEESSTIIEQLRQDLKLSEDKRSAISSELSSLVDACRVSEQKTLEIRNDNQALEGRLSQSSHENEHLRETCEELTLHQGVSEIVNSILLESVVTASSRVNEDTVRALQVEKEAAIERELESIFACRNLEADMAKLQATVQSQEAAIAKSSHYEEEVSLLRSKLLELEAVAQERDNLMRSLQEAQDVLHNLEDERANLLEAQKRERTAVPRTSSEETTADGGRSITANKRIVELESALRDAAKTVSATNSELLSAQALLVELSADKTAIRNELREAQDEIQLLNAKLSVRPSSLSVDPALSEISEQDHAGNESFPEGEMGAESQKLMEQRIKTANAEAENLRTALQRTINEADSASILLVQIQDKVDAVQSKLLSTRSSLQKSKEFEVRLQNDMREMKENHSLEVASMQDSLISLKSEMEINKEQHMTEAESLKKKLHATEEEAKAEKANLQGAIDKREIEIGNLREAVANLQVEVGSNNNKLKSISEKAVGLESSNAKYASTIRTLEGTVLDVNKSLVDSKQREDSLKTSLKESQEELEKNKNAFADDLRNLENQYKTEVAEFEAEIDRANEALEEAERTFRDNEINLKSKLRNLEERLGNNVAELEGTKESLASTTSDLQSMAAAKETLEEKLRSTAEEYRMTVVTMNTEASRAQELIDSLTKERNALETKLSDTKTSLEETSHSLREEREQRIMLEGENQDFLASVESLEASSKRLRDELTSKKNELATTGRQLQESQDVNKRISGEAKSLGEQLRSTQEDVKQLRTIRKRLESEADALRENLDALEATKESVEQDNSDLKAWVSDLERQATELQSAAENFEEVEQSLREALEGQRHVGEQNSALSEELKKEREALTLAEANMRSAIRDKTAAESARESSQKRASDLENRIREIREEHLAKVSSSEDAIRAKAQRCAELETELASAERKLAELASVSDTLFGVRAELQQGEEEMKGLRERAQSAEARAEELQVQLQGLEGEVLEMRESGSGDAYRALEAEHNELLVCLAELELECTSLKEELGRE